MSEARDDTGCLCAVIIFLLLGVLLDLHKAERRIMERLDRIEGVAPVTSSQ